MPRAALDIFDGPDWSPKYIDSLTIFGLLPHDADISVTIIYLMRDFCCMVRSQAFSDDRHMPADD